ncbi:MAG: ATP-binding cassette domain-containing protein [Betaproteobacteria bacterium]
MAQDGSPLVQMRGISKAYGGVQALKGADLDLHLGEVHALVGDNAAGKSTLVKTLAGAVQQDEGTVLFDGRPVEINDPRDAKALGVETVYQDLALADNLDVPANVFLGRELTHARPFGWFLDNPAMAKRSRELLDRLKINIPDVRQKVRSMSGGQRQSIAIARCVCFNARVIILDEPTAALGVQETDKVYALIREMRDHGRGVLIISHNLNHVFDNCDRITVMKTGSVVGSRRVSETDQDEIVKMIVSGSTEPARTRGRAESAVDVG